MKIFRLPMALTLFGAILVFYLKGLPGLLITLSLIALEISISFDNAIVNAAILKKMSKVWQDRFLTYGILIAVVGMRYILPVLIVAFSAKLSPSSVLDLIINHPKEYSSKILQAHNPISVFGGIFLIMVLLSFLAQSKPHVLWCKRVEKFWQKLTYPKTFNFVLGLVLATSIPLLGPITERVTLFKAAYLGLLCFAAIEVLIHSLASKTVGKSTKSLGLYGFIYLEVLDTSFSLDGVIAAFALSADLLVIFMGLAIGAIFVRVMTIHILEKDYLQTLPYLEHGAHYAIGLLGLSMISNVFIHFPGWMMAVTSLLIILASIYSSFFNSPKNDIQTK